MTAAFAAREIADARRRDHQLRRMTSAELAREQGFWQRRVALADEEAPAGTADVWRLLCEASLALVDLEVRERERAYAAGAPREDATGGVPAWVIAAIKTQLDLGGLIQRWGLTDLRAAGPGRWYGCCPFHEERHPSFYVYTADQHWHCFGCLAHGDVIDIAMRHGPWLSFREACAGLASAAGIGWPPADDTAPTHAPPARQRRARGPVFPA